MPQRRINREDHNNPCQSKWAITVVNPTVPPCSTSMNCSRIHLTYLGHMIDSRNIGWDTEVRGGVLQWGALV